MKAQKLAIYGTGGLAREVLWLTERMNDVEPMWEIIGLLDEQVKPGTKINGYEVLGGMNILRSLNESIAVVCAIGSAQIRKKVVGQIKEVSSCQFPNMIDPSVIMSQHVSLGEGNIICAGSILTTNIHVEDFVLINPSCNIGHDVRLNAYVTVYPAAGISGNVTVGTLSELGTGSRILQGLSVGDNVILGAGAVVIHDLPMHCTAVGVPAKVIRYSE